MPLAQVYLPIPDGSMTFIVDVHPRREITRNENTNCEHLCTLSLRIGAVDILVSDFAIEGVEDEEQQTPAAYARYKAECQKYVEAWLREDFFTEGQSDIVQELAQAMHILLGGQRSRDGEITVYPDTEETE